MDLLFVFIVALAVLWVVQALLVYRQGKAFMKRISALRREGRLAIGVGYNRFRLRSFVVVVVDRQDRVVRVERLSGLTVFARSQPIDRYVGLPLAELPDVARARKLAPALVTALTQAVDALVAGDPTSGAQRTAIGEEEGGMPISETI